MNTALSNKKISIFLFFAALLMFVGGCASKNQNSQGTIASDLPPLANSIGNYADIELPVDMKLDKDKTMSINTESFKGGILHYAGRVEMGSLKDFIIASMRNNKWKLVGEASYEYTLLAFTKPNQTCMVVLSEGMGGSLGKTHATLYVTVDLSSSGNVNPFGEPATPAN